MPDTVAWRLNRNRWLVRFGNVGRLVQINHRTFTMYVEEGRMRKDAVAGWQSGWLAADVDADATAVGSRLSLA